MSFGLFVFSLVAEVAGRGLPNHSLAALEGRTPPHAGPNAGHCRLLLFSLSVSSAMGQVR